MPDRELPVVESLEQEIARLRSLLGSERDPQGRAFVPLADAYRRAHDLPSALAIVDEGVARHPSLASAHVVRAWIHQDRGDREQAIAAFERVLELDDENVEGLRGLGILYLESGRPQDARPLLHRARALDPDDERVRALSESEPAPPSEVPPTRAGSQESFRVQPAAETPRSEHAAAELALEEHVPEEHAPPPEHTPEAPPEPHFELEPWDDPAAATAEAVLSGPPLENVSPLEQEPAPDVENVDGPGEFAAAAQDVAGDHERGAALEGLSEGRGDEGDLPIVQDEERPVLAAAAEALLSAPDAGEGWREPEPAELPPTRTLAEVFARQGLHDRAVQIYERLLQERPDDEELAARLHELRGEPEPPADARAHESPPDETETLALEMSRSTGAAGELSTPFAWAEERVPTGTAGGQPIRSYFQRLLSWEPGAEVVVEPSGGAAPPIGTQEEAGAGQTGTASSGDQAQAEADVAGPPVVPTWGQVWDEPIAEEAAPVAEPLAEPAEAVAELPAVVEPAPEVVPIDALAPEPAEAAPDAPDEWAGGPEALSAPVPVEALAPEVAEGAEEGVQEAPPVTEAALEAVALEVVAIEALAPEDTGPEDTGTVTVEEPPPAGGVTIVPIEALAPDLGRDDLETVPAPPGVVTIESLAPGPIVPVERLAPGPIVAIEALAPDPYLAPAAP